MDYTKKTKKELIEELLFIKKKNESFNERSYKELFDNSINLLYIQAEDGKFLDVNKEVLKVYGYKKEDIIGKYPDFLAAPNNDLNKIKKHIELAWKGKKQIFNFLGKKKDGSFFPKEIISQKEFYFGKEVLVSSARDITKQKIAEEYLKENEEKYRTLFTKNLAGVFITENKIIIDCNNSFAIIFGYKSRVELIGKKIDLLYFSKKDREIYIKELNKKEYLKNYKLRYKNKKGEEIWISTNVYLKENERIEGTLIDITEQVKTEKELEESKENYKKLIDNSSYATLIHVNGKIIYANKKAFQFIGLSNFSDLKSKTNIFDYLPKEYQKEALLRRKKVLKGKQIPFIELKIKKPLTGEIIDIETRSTVIDYNKQKAIHLVFQDISDRKKLSKEKLRATIAEESNKILQKEIKERKKIEEKLIENESKYRDLFENATDLIQSLDMKGNIVYVNNAWIKTLGYSLKEIENKNIFEIIHPDCTEKCNVMFNSIKKNKEGESEKASFELKTKNGKKINVEGYISIKFKNGKAVSTRAILRNTTEEIWDKTLQNVYNNIAKIVSEKNKPEEIYEGIRKEIGKIINTDIFSISYLLDENKIFFPYHYDVTKNEKERIEENQYKKKLIEGLIVVGKSKVLYKEEINKVLKKETLEKKPEVFVGVPLKIKNKVVGMVSVESYNNNKAFNNKAIEVLEFISNVLALTVQRKNDEKTIFKQSSKLKSIIENSTHLFWTYDKEKGVTSSNKNFVNYIKETSGRKKEEKDINKKRFSGKEKHTFWDEKYEKAYKGKAQYFISKKEDKKGEDIVKEVFLNPVYSDKGDILEISGIAHDITEKTLSEQMLKESLKEKEILLKEVHHRVKNNLQVISSILNLQSSYVKDEKTLDILRESQNRIKSMAFIHESLYQTTDFSQINFSEYIKSLSKNLVHTYTGYENQIKLDLKLKNISLNLDLSIPCGLILNELVSNSLKYAFLEKKKGVIKIELFEKNNNINLIVQDNGVGLPKEVNYKETESLGLQLVTTLVEQLEGKIVLDNKEGAKYTIIFKKE